MFGSNLSPTAHTPYSENMPHEVWLQTLRDHGLKVMSHLPKNQRGTSHDVTAAVLPCAQVLFLRCSRAPCQFKDKQPSRTTLQERMAVSDTSGSLLLAVPSLLRRQPMQRDHMIPCSAPTSAIEQRRKHRRNANRAPSHTARTCE